MAGSFSPMPAGYQRGRKAGGDCFAPTWNPSPAPSPRRTLLLFCMKAVMRPPFPRLGEERAGFDARAQAGRHVAGAAEPGFRSAPRVVALSLLDQKADKEAFGSVTLHPAVPPCRKYLLKQFGH